MSCNKEAWEEVFSAGEATSEGVHQSQHCTYEVLYNKAGNFHVVYNLKAIGSGKGYRPEDKSGKFVKFDLEQNKITESETDWDIAFRYSTIIVNGGEQTGRKDEPLRTANVSAYIAKQTFEQVQALDESLFRQDKAKHLAISDNVQDKRGLWLYSMQEHYVLPLSGRVAVFKTRNGHYFKMQVKSFYHCAPAIPKKADESFGYYTFRYAEVK